MANNNGCSYGKVNRNMFQNISKDFDDFKAEIREEFKDIKETNAQLYNHLSKRLPPWAVGLGALGIAIISGLMGVLIKGGL